MLFAYIAFFHLIVSFSLTNSTRERRYDKIGADMRRYPSRELALCI